MPFLAALGGYVTGTLIAIFMDRMYTGAPLRVPLSVCGGERLPALCWLGTAGYLLARGRCPNGCRLPARLWYLPLTGAAAGAAIALGTESGAQAALVTLFSMVLLAFVGTDFERHLLPNRLMYPTLALALALSWAWPDRGPASSVIGGLLGLVVMFVLFMLVPGFGFGDVKLAALLGLLTGITGVFSALMLGVLAAGVGAVVMLLTRRAGMKTDIAYGPYLALGAFVAMLTG
jgi:leader peptidase (prepilin peptidase)/N-methyltransferase